MTSNDKPKQVSTPSPPKPERPPKPTNVPGLSFGLEDINGGGFRKPPKDKS